MSPHVRNPAAGHSVNHVNRTQRFTRARPCPVCGGGDDDLRGVGLRCAGYRLRDGGAVVCTREKYAGRLERSDRVAGYIHATDLDCQCGTDHRSDAPVRAANDGKPGRPASRVVAGYEYRDERGALAYVVERREPKAFRQRRPDGRGGWIWNLDGVRRLLYRLPELIAEMKERPSGKRVVYVPEGEKDVDALRRLGLSATTNAGGAGKWRDEHTKQLRAAGVERVVILPDNDRAGEAHAVAGARSCAVAGLSVRKIRLPGLPPIQDKHGEDVSDWLNAGHTGEELAEVVRAAPTLDTATIEGPPTASGLDFTPLGALLGEKEEECIWLVDRRLPSAGLSLLAGKPKAGKSTLARCLALAVAHGEPWLGFQTTRGAVLYLALEEKRGEVRRHFEAMGASTDDPVFVLCASAPADGLARLRVEAEHRRPALIIVDPLFRLVRVPDGNDYAVMTTALEPLMRLAWETGAHVLAVHHLGKGERSGGDAILGSTAIFAAVDTALMLRRGDRYRTLSSIQRYGDDLDELTLSLDPGTRWITAGPSRAEADETDATGAIFAYLAPQSEPVEESAIHDAVEARRVLKQRALRRLIADGRVTRTGSGRRGDSYHYSVSGTEVPDICRVPENRESQATLSACRDGEVSGTGPVLISRDRPVLESERSVPQAAETLEL